MTTVEQIVEHTKRMEDLGWWVTKGGGDNPVLLLTGGDDDGHRVHVHVHYAPNFRSKSSFGQARFVSATFYWPEHGVDTTARTQERLWRLVESYAPKTPRED